MAPANDTMSAAYALRDRATVRPVDHSANTASDRNVGPHTIASGLTNARAVIRKKNVRRVPARALVCMIIGQEDSKDADRTEENVGAPQAGIHERDGRPHDVAGHEHDGCRQQESRGFCFEAGECGKPNAEISQVERERAGRGDDRQDVDARKHRLRAGGDFHHRGAQQYPCRRREALDVLAADVVNESVPAGDVPGVHEKDVRIVVADQRGTGEELRQPCSRADDDQEQRKQSGIDSRTARSL